jgi:demethoxyubiquinone hydroxylase (CLK1/Coq7/Cat5 family)
MKLSTIKEIEEQIDYHLETYDKSLEEGNNKIAVDCMLVIESLLDQLKSDEIKVVTEKVMQ